MPDTTSNLDPVTLTVIQNGLIQVCNEMDLAFVRSASFGRSYRLPQDYLYGGRDDIPPYDERALRPTRPYGIPVTAVVQGSWLDPAPVADRRRSHGARRSIMARGTTAIARRPECTARSGFLPS